MTEALARDIDRGSDPRHPFRLWLAKVRAWIERYPRVRVAYKVVVAIIGVTITLVGVVLIPLPGPGWLIVFLGIAVLGTEFAAAKRFSTFLRRMLTKASDWWKRRREMRRAARAARASRASGASHA